MTSLPDASVSYPREIQPARFTRADTDPFEDSSGMRESAPAIHAQNPRERRMDDRKSARDWSPGSTKAPDIPLNRIFINIYGQVLGRHATAGDRLHRPFDGYAQPGRGDYHPADG